MVEMVDTITIRFSNVWGINSIIETSRKFDLSRAPTDTNQSRYSSPTDSMSKSTVRFIVLTIIEKNIVLSGLLVFC